MKITIEPKTTKTGSTFWQHATLEIGAGEVVYKCHDHSQFTVKDEASVKAKRAVFKTTLQPKGPWLFMIHPIDGSLYVNDEDIGG